MSGDPNPAPQARLSGLRPFRARSDTPVNPARPPIASGTVNSQTAWKAPWRLNFFNKVFSYR